MILLFWLYIQHASANKFKRTNSNVIIPIIKKFMYLRYKFERLENVFIFLITEVYFFVQLQVTNASNSFLLLQIYINK